MKTYLFIIAFILLFFSSYSQNRDFYKNRLLKKVENKSKIFLEMMESEQIKYLDNILINLSCLHDDNGAEIISIFVIQTYIDVSDLVRSHLLGLLRRFLYTEQKVRMFPENLLIEKYPVDKLTKSIKIILLPLFDELCLCSKFLDDYDKYPDMCKPKSIKYRNCLIEMN